MVARAFKEDSLYTLKLSRQGIALQRREDVIMRSHTVGEVMRPAAFVINDRMPIGEAVRYFLQHEVVTAYVTDVQDLFVGTISIHDIKDPEVRDLLRGCEVHFDDIRRGVTPVPCKIPGMDLEAMNPFG